MKGKRKRLRLFNFFSLMGKFALLLMSYWMGHIHWTMSELGPQIKVGQTFRSYWMFTTCANWGRIRMYHHAVLERLDSPLCMKGTWSQTKIDWKVKIGDRIMQSARMTFYITMSKLDFNWPSLCFPVGSWKSHSKDCTS